MKNKPILWIILTATLCCSVMALVDGVIRPPYAVKSAIKLVLFLGLPWLLTRLTGSLPFKTIFRFRKRGFGIALGLVMGRFLHAWMVLTVEVELVMFGRTAPPYAYVLAVVLTVVFSVAVNVAAHFRLKKVDMVESLKTVE